MITLGLTKYSVNTIIFRADGYSWEIKLLLFALDIPTAFQAAKGFAYGMIGHKKGWSFRIEEVSTLTSNASPLVTFDASQNQPAWNHFDPEIVDAFFKFLAN